MANEILSPRHTLQILHRYRQKIDLESEIIIVEAVTEVMEVIIGAIPFNYPENKKYHTIISQDRQQNGIFMMKSLQTSILHKINSET